MLDQVGGQGQEGTSCLSSCSASVLVMFLQYHLHRDEIVDSSVLTIQKYLSKQK